MSTGAVRLIAELLRARTGQQLQPDRWWRIETALAPLLRSSGIDLDELAIRVVSGAHPTLADTVVDALLNNETSFFRDARVFALFAERGLARLERERTEPRRLSIWCAGCSTGQEAYSVAMVFAREPRRWAGWHIDILGTDVSERAIAAARAGQYGHFEIQRGLSAADMVRWFERDGEGWRAGEALRTRVRFTVRSLLEPAPAPGLFDVVFCRNVLFYFPPATRAAVLARLAAAMRSDGVLVMGAGEALLGQEDAFVSDYEARGLYRPAIGAGGSRAA